MRARHRDPCPRQVPSPQGRCHRLTAHVASCVRDDSVLTPSHLPLADDGSICTQRESIAFQSLPRARRSRHPSRRQTGSRTRLPVRASRARRAEPGPTLPRCPLPGRPVSTMTPSRAESRMARAIDACSLRAEVPSLVRRSMLVLVSRRIARTGARARTAPRRPTRLRQRRHGRRHDRAGTATPAAARRLAGCAWQASAALRAAGAGSGNAVAALRAARTGAPGSVPPARTGRGTPRDSANSSRIPRSCVMSHWALRRASSGSRAARGRAVHPSASARSRRGRAARRP